MIKRLENKVNKQLWQSRQPTLLPTELDDVYVHLKHTKKWQETSSTKAKLTLDLYSEALVGALLL